MEGSIAAFGASISVERKLLFNIQEAFGFVRLVLSGWCNVLFHHELAMVMEGTS